MPQATGLPHARVRRPEQDAIPPIETNGAGPYLSDRSARLVLLTMASTHGCRRRSAATIAAELLRARPPRVGESAVGTGLGHRGAGRRGGRSSAAGAGHWFQSGAGDVHQVAGERAPRRIRRLPSREPAAAARTAAGGLAWMPAKRSRSAATAAQASGHDARESTRTGRMPFHPRYATPHGRHRVLARVVPRKAYRLPRRDPD